MRYAGLTVVAALTVIAACSSSTSYGGSSGGSGGPGPNQVFMQSSTFNPSSRTVSVGTTVQWVNQDGYGHTVTSDTGTVLGGSVAGGASYSHTFNTAGTYPYYCTIHGTPTTGMRGTIVVQ